MYCPSCLFPNPHNARACVSCHADIHGLRDQVAVGAQFLFVDASARRPVALSLDGRPPRVYDGPTVFSRHRYGVGLGEGFYQPSKVRAAELKPEVQFPRLPPPRGPQLTAVITDRKIYRPREEAQIVVLAPASPGAGLEMEVQLAGQAVFKEQLTLDDAGLALRPYADLEAGEYTVLVRSRGNSGAGDSPAQCTFSVAEFSLSPLIARLKEQRYDAAAARLTLRLSVQLLSVPYDGPAELALQSAGDGGRVVARQQVTVRDGRVEASFVVAGFVGPFHAELATPDGGTASVMLPGTAQAERERVTLCPLGKVASASLLAGEDTREVRGLHVGYGAVENTPLRLESAVGRAGRVTAALPAAAMQVVTFQPLTGETTVYDKSAVDPGDAIEFPVEAPYTLFTAALLGPRLPYEAWGVVVSPPELAAGLQAPTQAAPGDDIVVRVESERAAVCLLLVYDARLEHESPAPKLARRLLDAVRDSGGQLREQTAPLLSSQPWWPWQGGLDDTGAVWRGGAPTLGMPVLRAMAAPPNAPKGSWLAEGLPVGIVPPSPGGPQATVAAEPLTFVAVPSREDFPELAFFELLAVHGSVDRSVRLGDQIGAWRCRAYLLAGLDVLELTADVEVSKPVYAELDLPAIAGAGDDVLAGVRYHTPGPAVLTVTLPDGRSTSGAVLGHGVEYFRLTGPGEVSAHLSGAAGDDWTARSVDAAGVQTITASRLEILNRGETAQGQRVAVYPGPADVLRDTIEALGRYPFG